LLAGLLDGRMPGFASSCHAQPKHAFLFISVLALWAGKAATWTGGVAGWRRCVGDTPERDCALAGSPSGCARIVQTPSDGRRRVVCCGSRTACCLAAASARNLSKRRCAASKEGCVRRRRTARHGFRLLACLCVTRTTPGAARRRRYNYLTRALLPALYCACLPSLLRLAALHPLLPPWVLHSIFSFEHCLPRGRPW